jgi:plasmid stabilization system protein ParE
MAKVHLDEIYDHIAQDSLSAARYVKKELIKLAGSLNDFPEKYSKEEYLIGEPENYRSITRNSILTLMKNTCQMS